MKTLIGLAAGLALVIAVPAWADVTVDVNGQPVAFDQPPIMQGGRVLVPLRGVFEKLGATVQYNAAARNIVAQSGATSIALQIGSTMATVNGQQQSLDAPPILVGGRAMVPLRFVSQSLGAQVAWNESQQLVSITAGQGAEQSYHAPPRHNPHPAAPAIARIDLDDGRLRDRHLGPGETFTIRVSGEPRGQATFDVGDNRGLPMHEASAGVYTGQYTVRQQDMGRQAQVNVHITMPDGRKTSRTADETVALVSAAKPPAPPEPKGRPQQAQHEQIVRSVVRSGTGTLEVTMVGTARGTATFDVGSHQGMAMTEPVPGTYLGRYQVPAGEASQEVRIVAHLSLPNGETQSMAAPPGVSLHK